MFNPIYYVIYYLIIIMVISLISLHKYYSYLKSYVEQLTLMWSKINIIEIIKIITNARINNSILKKYWD
jgi:hypothetical protein